MTPPLTNKRIVVTRAEGQGGTLTAALQAAGAEVIALPTILIVPPLDPAPLDAALRRLGEFDGFIFTSANGVRALFARASQLGLETRARGGSWVAAVGPATAAALPAPWRADHVAAEHHADGLLATLEAVQVAGRELLLPRAASATTHVPLALAARGARVTAVAAYHSMRPETSRARALALFPPAPETPRVDAAVLTSASTAQNLADLLGADYRQRLAGVAVAAIGPVTRVAIENLGLTVAIEAGKATTKSLVEGLAGLYA